MFWLLTGDRLNDVELEEIIEFTHTEEDLDGNIKYGGECFLYMTKYILILFENDNQSLDCLSCDNFCLSIIL